MSSPALSGECLSSCWPRGSCVIWPESGGARNAAGGGVVGSTPWSRLAANRDNKHLQAAALPVADTLPERFQAVLSCVSSDTP